jgi:hypothetical protein
MVVVSFVLFSILIFAWLAAPDRQTAESPEPAVNPAGSALPA